MKSVEFSGAGMKLACSRTATNRMPCQNKENAPGTLGPEGDGECSKVPVARRNARDEHDPHIPLAVTRSMVGCGAMRAMLRSQI